MSKPYIHAQSSARKYGGKPEDYLEIHSFMDSSKGAIADNRHRALTHNSWFIMTVIPRIFGETFKNSENKVISTRDICEQHILEDFRGQFIPTPQDYLQEIEFKPWMQNGNGYPPSSQKIEQNKKSKINTLFEKPEDIVFDGSRVNFNNKLVD